MKTFTKTLFVGACLALGQQASAQVLLDNFENTRLVIYPNNSGVLVQNVANPGSNPVNSSPTVASYARNGGVQFDYLVVKPLASPGRFANVADYAAGTKRISMKFRSPAAGVRVELVLQNGARANTNMYPNGKFGGDFVATTTVANAWETLTFTYTAASAGNFDPSVGPTDIDQMTVLIAPNSNIAATYHIDDIVGPEIAPPTGGGTGMAVRQTYDNFDGTRAIKYIAYKSSGGLKIDTLNNAPSAANNSPRVMRYTRSTNQYDALVVHPRGAPLADVTPFRTGAQRMTMKVFSPAPGILFQITLQDSTIATGPNYPAGRNSEYTATTTATNAWETLTFNFVNAPSTTPSTGLNEIVLLVAPNTFNLRKVYIDDWTGPSLTSFVAGARTVQTSAAAFAPAYPNPTHGITTLPFSLEKAATVSLAVYDALGRQVSQVLSNVARPAGQFTAEVNTAKLAPGLYTCRLLVDGVVLTRPLSVE